MVEALSSKAWAPRAFGGPLWQRVARDVPVQVCEFAEREPTQALNEDVIAEEVGEDGEKGIRRQWTSPDDGWGMHLSSFPMQDCPLAGRFLLEQPVERGRQGIVFRAESHRFADNAALAALFGAGQPSWSCGCLDQERCTIFLQQAQRRVRDAMARPFDTFAMSVLAACRAL